MDESTSKRLAEFVGVCWHEWEEIKLPKADINFSETLGSLPPETTPPENMGGRVGVIGWARRKCVLCGVEAFTPEAKAAKVPDFTTPDGWQLIADEIAKRGEWKVLYKWLYEKDIPAERYIFPSMNGCDFHELQPAEKSTIVAEWCKEVER